MLRETIATGSKWLLDILRSLESSQVLPLTIFSTERVCMSHHQPMSDVFSDNFSKNNSDVRTSTNACKYQTTTSDFKLCHMIANISS